MPWKDALTKHTFAARKRWFTKPNTPGAYTVVIANNMNGDNGEDSNGQDSNGENSNGNNSNDETGNDKTGNAKAGNSKDGNSESSIDEIPARPRLLYSERIGFPPYILNPEDLAKAENLCPGKMGPRIIQGEAGTLVKYGIGVRLAEAEAMDFIAEKTSIRLPRLEAAYTLDGTTYIVMSYEHDQLKDYVQQMQAISGNFIGSVDESYCEDGVFSAWGSENMTYGPFDSESSFNEGIIQALQNRLTQPIAEGETESTSRIRDHFLHAAVRSLKDHPIVFCHADLHPSNMLIRDDGTVILLDWGCAGFWHAYWKWYRVMATYAWRASWQLEMEKCVPPFHIECLVMERVSHVLWN